MSLYKTLKREKLKESPARDTRWDRIRKRLTTGNQVTLKSEAVRRFINMDFIGKNERFLKTETSRPLDPQLVMNMRHELFKKIPKKLPLATVATKHKLQSCIKHNLVVEEHMLENELNKLRLQLENNHKRNKLDMKMKDLYKLDNDDLIESFEETSKHIGKFYLAPMEAMQKIENLCSAETATSYQRQVNLHKNMVNGIQDLLLEENNHGVHSTTHSMSGVKVNEICAEFTDMYIAEQNNGGTRTKSMLQKNAASKNKHAKIAVHKAEVGGKYTKSLANSGNRIVKRYNNHMEPEKEVYRHHSLELKSSVLESSKATLEETYVKTNAMQNRLTSGQYETLASHIVDQSISQCFAVEDNDDDDDRCASMIKDYDAMKAYKSPECQDFSYTSDSSKKTSRSPISYIVDEAFAKALASAKREREENEAHNGECEQEWHTSTSNQLNMHEDRLKKSGHQDRLVYAYENNVDIEKQKEDADELHQNGTHQVDQPNLYSNDKSATQQENQYKIENETKQKLHQVYMHQHSSVDAEELLGSDQFGVQQKNQHQLQPHCMREANGLDHQESYCHDQQEYYGQKNKESCQKRQQESYYQDQESYRLDQQKSFHKDQLESFHKDQLESIHKSQQEFLQNDQQVFHLKNQIQVGRNVHFDKDIAIRSYGHDNSSGSNTGDDLDSIISDLAEEALLELQMESKTDAGENLKELIIEMPQNNATDELSLSELSHEKQNGGNRDLLVITKLQVPVLDKPKTEEISTTITAEDDDNDDDEESTSNEEQQQIIQQLFQPRSNRNKEILRKYFLKWMHFTTIEKIERESCTVKHDRIRKINIFLDKIRTEKRRINQVQKECNNDSDEEHKEKEKPPIKGIAQMSKKYQNKIKMQQDIIDLQRLKLERQERLIMELKLHKLSDEAKEARQELKQELKSVMRSGESKAKAKAKCLQLIGNLRDAEDEETARLQGKALLQPKFLMQMQERALERSVRHEQARQRRLQKEAEREAQKIAAEEAKRLEDEAAKRMRIEYLNEKRRQEKMAKILKERERQRAIENNRKAQEFYRRLLLKRIAMEGFKRLVQLKRDNRQKCEALRRKILRRTYFIAWRDHYKFEMSQKIMRADNLYEKILKRNAFAAWGSYVENEHSKYFVAIDWYDLKLSESVFGRWLKYTRERKKEEEAKMVQAKAHHEWHLKWKVMDCWQRLPQILQLEKETEERRQRWRMKIWELLPDYKPNRDSLWKDPLPRI